jgi:hypothetical protein
MGCFRSRCQSVGADRQDAEVKGLIGRLAGDLGTRVARANHEHRTVLEVAGIPISVDV